MSERACFPYGSLVFYIFDIFDINGGGGVGGDYTPDSSGSVTDSTHVMEALADGQL